MMNRIAIAAFALMTALPVFAQPTGDRPRPGNRIDFLAGALSLTDAQKQQATAIFDAASQAAETLRGELSTAHNNLRTAVKSNSSDTQLDTLAAAVGTIEGRLVAVNAKAQAKFYALLTAEQKTKYDELGAGRGGPGRGPGGPMGRPERF